MTFHHSCRLLQDFRNFATSKGDFYPELDMFNDFGKRIDKSNYLFPDFAEY